MTLDGNLEINLINIQRREIDTNVDPIQLSIFSHRFMSIAEQMGSVLQRSAISTNIKVKNFFSLSKKIFFKERLDFSCALFGPDGNLVANAPHIPVHLGKENITILTKGAFFKVVCNQL